MQTGADQNAWRHAESDAGATRKFRRAKAVGLMTAATPSNHQLRGGGTGGRSRSTETGLASSDTTPAGSNTEAANVEAGSKTRNAFSSSFGAGAAGVSCFCFAALTALQSSHGASGLKVRAMASPNGIVSALVTIIRAQAKTCTTSHGLPLAKN